MGFRVIRTIGGLHERPSTAPPPFAGCQLSVVSVAVCGEYWGERQRKWGLPLPLFTVVESDLASLRPPGEGRISTFLGDEQSAAVVENDYPVPDQIAQGDFAEGLVLGVVSSSQVSGRGRLAVFCMEAPDFSEHDVLGTQCIYG